MNNTKDLLLDLVYKQCGNIIYDLNKVQQMINIIKNDEKFNIKINEIIEKLNEIFVNSKIELSIKYDYIGIIIKTFLEQEKANKLLNKFKKEYWDNQSSEIKKLVYINIEYILKVIKGE